MQHASTLSKPAHDDALGRLLSLSKKTNGPKSNKLERPPPRTHLLQTPVYQVVNANTVKERYLFLFNDLLLICKPIMDENIIIGSNDAADDTTQPDHKHRHRPNENSLFQVKNIVELSKITLFLSREEHAQHMQHRPSITVGPDGRPLMSPPPRRMHPVLSSALRKFETDPNVGIQYLIEKQVLGNEPLSIANFLFKTPDLNRRQLGYYLADPARYDVYDCFLDCFRLAGLRLDEALRILLMTLRLPSSWEALEYLIERFSKKWHDANQNVVKFHEDMVVKVVVAMLFLNAELWYEASSDRDVFWSARERKERKDRLRLTRRASMMERKHHDRENVAVEPLHYISAKRAQGSTRPSSDEFLERWKHYDQYELVPQEFLEEMYRSIAVERLETGWDNEADEESMDDMSRMISVTPHRFPTRLTKGVASAPITISIPEPDAGLQIKLRGQDLVCEPSVLDFSTSCVQTFTITGHTLGRTSLMFIKAGHHANRYVSPTLPRTKSIVVVRSYMRYTFQVGFSHADWRVKTPLKSPASPELDLGGSTPIPVGGEIKRKYTFSVDTEQERRDWIAHLRQHCGQVQVMAPGEPSKLLKTSTPTATSPEERVALQVLKEVLLADEIKKGTANVTLRNLGTGSLQLPIRSSVIETPTQSVQSPSFKEPGQADDLFGEPKVTASTTNVVTKRGYEVVKLVVQNSMVPLMLGFLRTQIPS